MIRALLLALALAGCSSSSTNFPDDELDGAAAPDGAAPDAPKPVYSLCEAVPGEYAFPCGADDDCIGHRCNQTYGKCAWPCASDCDCRAGYHCEAPACVSDP